MTPSTTSNIECTALSSNDKSPFKLYDNSLFKLYDNSPSKQMIETPQTDISFDRSRHLCEDQSSLLPPPIDRTTKTRYTLRQQPQIDCRLFTSPSNL